MTPKIGREPVDDARYREYSPLLKAAAQSYTSSVRQLFSPTNVSGLDIASLGSACLISLRGWRFVLTAGHVAAAQPQCARYIMPNDGELIEIVGFRHHPAVGDTTKERFDIAIAQLDVRTADKLAAKGCEFLESCEFDTSPPVRGAPPAVYAGLGYPHSMTKRIGRTVFRSQPFVFPVEHSILRSIRDSGWMRAFISRLTAITSACAVTLACTLSMR